VVIQWLDYLGTLRSRILPIASFASLMSNSGSLGISKGNLGTTQNDHMSEVCDPVGQIMVRPDLQSLRMMDVATEDARGPDGSLQRTATVMASFDDDEEGKPLDLCPRSRLHMFTEQLKQEHGVHVLVGFEIEITFVRRRNSKDRTNDSSFEPLDQHNWGSLTDRQLLDFYPLLTNIVNTLKAIGIPVQHFHSEAGAGQYEFVLPPLPSVQAVDTLVQAKQCIQRLVAAAGAEQGEEWRATCHPMPFPGIGTAAHAHVSLNSDSKTDEEVAVIQKSFIAAVLEHLPGLCAFMMPQPISYNRVAEDSWTGGVWVAWGTQNRETPLRHVAATGGNGIGKGSRWEIRCLDGMANMYLALAALLGVGVYGIKEKIELRMQDCCVNPSQLSDGGRSDLGVEKRLPGSLHEALEALKEDEELQGAVGTAVKHYLGLKKAEQKVLGEMQEERRVWEIERY
jgi:glutamine synthetase